MVGLTSVANDMLAGPDTVILAEPIQPFASLAVMVNVPIVNAVKEPEAWNVVPFLLYV